MEMVEAVKMAMEAVQEAGFTTATSDNVTSIACTIYIQANRGGGGGGYSRSSNGGGNGSGGYKGKDRINGDKCALCGSELKTSKAGNRYCGCWYN